METYISRLNKAINAAMNRAYMRDQTRPTNVFVANILLCKGVPFYGYHVGWVPFLKIYMVNPKHMSKLAELLRNGEILGNKFDPYEAHIPYILQFLTDFNLAGCSKISISSALFRGPLKAGATIQTGVFDSLTVSNELILPIVHYRKMGFCELEIDIDASSIENRKKIVQRNLHHNFDEEGSMKKAMESAKDQAKSLSQDPEDSFYISETQNLFENIKFVNSLKDVWLDEFNRRSLEHLSTFKEFTFFSQQKQSQNFFEFWRRGQELEAQLEKLINESKAELGNTKIDFQNFVKDKGYMHLYPTALDTVGVMFKTWPAIFKELSMESLTTVPKKDDQQVEKVEEEEMFSGDEEKDEANEDEAADFDIDEELKELDDLDFDDLLSYPRPRSNASMIRQADNELEQNTTVESEVGRAAGKNRLEIVLEEEPDFKPFQTSTPIKDSSCLASDKKGKHAFPKSQVSFALNSTILYDAETPTSIVPLKRPVSSDSDSTDLFRPRVAKSLKTILDSPASQSVSYSTILPFFSSSLAKKNSTLSKSNSHRMLKQLSRYIVPSSENKKILMYQLPPTVDEVCDSFREFGLPSTQIKRPFFSNPNDISKKPIIVARTEFWLKGNDIEDPGPHYFENPDLERVARLLDSAPCCTEETRFQYIPKPPSYDEVLEWCQNTDSSKPTQLSKDFFKSQIDAATQNNRHGFKFASQRRNETRKAKLDTARYLSVITLELHIKTREHFFPDPVQDPIEAIFWTFQFDCIADGSLSGCICLCNDADEAKRLESTIPKNYILDFEPDELSMICRLVSVVRKYDPDILAGYEINASSWGYIIGRGRNFFDYDLCLDLGRVNEKAQGKVGDRWGSTHTSAIKITGRHMLNVWRVLRNELALQKYSLENVAFHALHRRIPSYSYETLTTWYSSAYVSESALAVKYHIQRLEATTELINTQEIIIRTAEEASIIGIDFYSVFYRGSQFKVESILTRIAKAENFLLASPSKSQVGQQNAIECLPLILEPETKFYTSPVVVLDFQSLYPSVMIAYNYCYSTCLGRLEKWKGKNKLGVTNLNLPKGLVHLLGKENITVAPNGIVYVKPSVRKSILAKILTEFLETRVMVKDGMKSNKSDAAFQKLMNSRQLALKLIANVTYGYTSATYSGRMPCVEIADSIVQTGRETMERAIEHIKSNFDKWGAETVYGDTDSLFIHFPGRTKDEAFDLGQEIADSITEMNPRPMKLKFEKVYYPCILQTKKRYVGYMYEHKSQKDPIFNAKGIETVRRDGTPAQQKIEEKALKILFDTYDLSLVKTYLQSQWSKINEGSVSIQDFCFAKEVRLDSYKAGGRLPPGAALSTKKLELDPNAGPQYRERVPYVVVAGAPGERLVDRCVWPEVLLNNPGTLRLDTEYYITKNLIPPLDRLFSLVGVDITKWYTEMPISMNKFTTLQNGNSARPVKGAKRSWQQGLKNFFSPGSCKVCGGKVTQKPSTLNTNLNRPEPSTIPQPTDLPTDANTVGDQVQICENCRTDHQYTTLVLAQRARDREKDLTELDTICQNCSTTQPGTPISCISQDCPIYYSRKKAIGYYNQVCKDEWFILSKALEW